MRDSLVVKITSVKRLTPDVTALYFARPFEFIAGQYLTVFVPDSRVTEGKAYSIASRPSDPLLAICVKNVGGEFSSYLCSRQRGDTLIISSQAYGFFNPQTDRPLVGITGGCGLSPIWSVLASRPAGQSAQLFYSVRRPDDVVFADKLAASNIACQLYSTQVMVEAHGDWHNGRFVVADIVAQCPVKAHFLLCGRLELVHDIRAKLNDNGVSDARISTEVFFEQ